MNENTPPENDMNELPTEPRIEPAPMNPAPHWALDKFRRNSVVGGAVVLGAVAALAGASLIGDDEGGGPPGMRGDYQGHWAPPPGQMGQGPAGPGQMGQGQPGQGQSGQAQPAPR
jgi:hypothetical protein